MRKTMIASALMLGLAATAGAEGTVQVRFTDTSQFADFGEAVRDREENQAELTRFLQSLGKGLANGQQLQIEVRDVNLAGELEWLRRRNERLRVLRWSTSPMIELSYTLSEGGRTIRSEKSTLRDMGYLDHLMPVKYRSEPMQHEKRMLDEWFERSVLNKPR